MSYTAPSAATDREELRDQLQHGIHARKRGAVVKDIQAGTAARDLKR